MKCSGTWSVTLTVRGQDVCVPYTTATTHVQTVISVNVALLMGLCGQPVGTDRGTRLYRSDSCCFIWQHTSPIHNHILFKKSQKSKLSLENKNLKWGEISLWNKCFFSNTCWTQLLVALEIIMSKIYLNIFPFLFKILSTRAWLWTCNYPAMASCFTEI